MPHVLRPVVASIAVLLAAAAPAHAADWPQGFSKCADERGVCKVGATARKVSYGARDQWVVKTLKGDIACTNETFGRDPLVGKRKKCALGPVDTAPTEPPTQPNAALEAAPDDGWAGAIAPGGTTTGGGKATAQHIFIVSSASQLRGALEQSKGQAALIKVHGRIDMAAADNGGAFRSPEDQKARGSIALGSNQTLIGLGADATIVNGSIRIRRVDNVIVRNLNIVNPCDIAPEQAGDGSWDARYDGIDVDGATRVWIDHNRFGDAAGDKAKHCHDGALDIKNASDFVTVSFNVFENHDKNTLVGHDDDASGDEGHLRVSFHHNRWKDVVQRAPRVRYGRVHVWNNWFEGDRKHADYPHAYSIGVGHKAKVISEANAFDIRGAQRCGEIAKAPAARAGAFTDRGSQLNGAALQPAQCGLSEAVGWTVPYAYAASDAATARARVLVQAGTGRLSVR